MIKKLFIIFTLIFLFTGSTRVWAGTDKNTLNYSTAADFNKGKVTNATISNDGKIKLFKKPNITHTTQSDFATGTYYSKNKNYFSTVTSTNDGEITVQKEKGFCIAATQIPVVTTAKSLGVVYYASFEDNYAYVRVRNYQNSLKEGDDTNMGYYQTLIGGTMPAGPVESLTYIDTLNWLLVGSTGNGLIIIDTKGTTTLSDDVYIGKYDTAFAGGNMSDAPPLKIQYEGTNTTLYLASKTAVYAVNTHGSSNIANHTLTFRINSSSPVTENITAESIDIAHYDTTSKGLWVAYSKWIDGFGWYRPLVLMDTTKIGTGQNAIVATFGSRDNTLIAGTFNGKETLFDDNLIYTADPTGKTIKVINTHHSLNPAIFTIDTTYTLSTSDQSVYDLVIDKGSNTLFVGNGTDMKLIDVSTGSVKMTYDSSYKPTSVGNLFFSPQVAYPVNDWMFVNTSSFLCAQGLYNHANDEWYYPVNAAYESTLIPIDGKPFKFSWDQSLNELPATSVTAGYKTGTRSNYDQQFGTGVTTVTSTYYQGWGGEFGTITTENNGLKLANPSNSDVYTWIETGKPEDYFPAGSTVTIDFITGGSTSTKDIWFFGDNWSGSGSNKYTVPNNVGQTATFTETAPFSRIGVEMNKGSGLAADDYIEIKSIKIQFDTWDSSWTSIGSTNTGTVITPESSDNLFKYQLTLTPSTDQESAPVIEAVTLDTGYTGSGTYTSETINALSPVKWEQITVDATMPTATTMTVATREGNSAAPDQSWTTWQEVTNQNIGTTGEYQYLQYKVDMNTTNTMVTPQINTVSVKYSWQVGDNPSEGNSFSSNSGGKDICTAQASNTPNLFQIRVFKNKAVVYFVGLADKVDRYEIAYGNKNKKEQYLDILYRGAGGGVLSRDINLLEANTEYYFKMKASNGCAGSGWSKEIRVKTPSKSNVKMDFYPPKDTVVKKVGKKVANTLTVWKTKLIPQTPAKAESAIPNQTPQISEAPKVTVAEPVSQKQTAPQTVSQSWWQKITQFFKK